MDKKCLLEIRRMLNDQKTHISVLRQNTKEVDEALSIVEHDINNMLNVLQFEEMLKQRGVNDA